MSLVNRFISYFSKEPILIYQMGKVGSSSIYSSLKKTCNYKHVFHLHMLNNLDQIEKNIIETRPNPEGTLKQIQIGRDLRKRLLSKEFKTLNIITLVRDPVARNVSAFFQNLLEVIPDFDETAYDRESLHDRLKHAFLNNYSHNAPLGWLDSQLKDVFDVDVFKTPFPKEKGYSIYHSERINLLVLRMEDMNRCTKSAMKEFLNLRNFSLISSNIGQQKKYGNTYKSFVSGLTLPVSYLDNMYNSKYAKHFYSEEEIANFRKRWV